MATRTWKYRCVQSGLGPWVVLVWTCAPSALGCVRVLSISALPAGQRLRPTRSPSTQSDCRTFLQHDTHADQPAAGTVQLLSGAGSRGGGALLWGEIPGRRLGQPLHWRRHRDGPLAKPRLDHRRVGTAIGSGPGVRLPRRALTPTLSQGERSKGTPPPDSV